MVACTVILLAFAGAVFWYQDWRYSLPTPRQVAFVQPETGTVPVLPASFKSQVHAAGKPVFLNFFNPACPCSEFNLDHVRTLIKLYSARVPFVINLAGNAIKFTAKGSVVIHVEYVDSRLFCVSVIDTGIGIPKDIQGLIFDRFTQAGYTTTRRFGGTGLGLSVNSPPGEGSTFWITLALQPCAAVPEPSATGMLNSLARALDGARGRILIADDNPVNLLLATRLIQKMGYRVEVASNDLEAVKMWATFTFNAILMDCQMPEMDGFEAAAMAGDRERCLEAGMDDHLSKPLRAEDVAATLAKWVGQAQGQHVS